MLVHALESLDIRSIRLRTGIFVRKAHKITPVYAQELRRARRDERGGRLHKNENIKRQIPISGHPE
jgi:hypothetical protein